MKLHSHHFASDPSEPCPVKGWFDALPERFEVLPTASGLLLHFVDMGELEKDPSGHINGVKSPVVLLVEPSIRRGALWTLGEVKFLPSGLTKAFPALARIRKGFAAWIEQQPLVHVGGRPGAYDHFLEGGAANLQAIFAFDSGLSALRRGQYFVAPLTGEASLDAVCRKLVLRGVECA